MTWERRHIVLAVLEKAFPDYPCFMGYDYLPRLKATIASGAPFIYADHAYMDRGYHRGNFRVVLSGVHQKTIKPADKPKGYQMRAQEWKKGSHILVFPPSKTMAQTFDAEAWTGEVCGELAKHTDRKVKVKHKNAPEPLEHYLKDCHAVVGYGTVASVEAALFGIPAFCGANCPATPIGLQDLSQIESPIYPDREPWFTSMTWSQFHLSEIQSGLCREIVLGAG